MFHIEVIGIDSSGKPCIAAVAVESGMAVIARYDGVEWQAAHGIKPDGENIPVPACFRFIPEAQQALDDLRSN